MWRWNKTFSKRLARALNRQQSARLSTIRVMLPSPITRSMPSLSYLAASKTTIILCSPSATNLALFSTSLALWRRNGWLFSSGLVHLSISTHSAWSFFSMKTIASIQLLNFMARLIRRNELRSTRSSESSNSGKLAVHYSSQQTWQLVGSTSQMLTGSCSLIHLNGATNSFIESEGQPVLVNKARPSFSWQNQKVHTRIICRPSLSTSKMKVLCQKLPQLAQKL